MVYYIATVFVPGAKASSLGGNTESQTSENNNNSPHSPSRCLDMSFLKSSFEE